MSVFVQQRLGKSRMESQSYLEIFVFRVRKLIVSSPYIWYNKIVEFSDGSIPYGHLISQKLLIYRKMSRADLRRAVGIASNTLIKLNRDEEVTLETLGKICGVLGVNIGDIVDLLPTV